MAEATAVEVETSQVVTQVGEESMVLRLHKPKTDRKVKWEEGVVDNELMGKKKSKCCCIYNKPHKFGESDSESDPDEDDCCHEHRIARRRVPKQHGSGSRDQTGDT
ncbi:E3 ubiquitin-protein ligase PPP1R11-like [Halichondria panicea]|uniref:E3 ubiquitin-protein ligase PPP1R11-like n=1 Tax=Halichondria panicea TaxID=6063 RepID=UPI00312B48F3